MACSSPLDEDAIRSFALGLEEVLVIEEKGPFLERLVRDALYGGSATPLVVGHRDERGGPLVPAHGALEPDAITRVIGARVLAHEDIPAVRERLARLDEIAWRPRVDLGVARSPFFCSGCPHNSSMVASEQAVVGAGIGCHTMVMLAGRHHGQVAGTTQMGSEGAQWIGVAPFVDVPHFVQNLGDGTFHHSGSLAIRAAVAAGLNVTYKLLVNGYVAMTGGQLVEGQMAFPRSHEASRRKAYGGSSSPPRIPPATATWRCRPSLRCATAARSCRASASSLGSKASRCCCTIRRAPPSCGASASAAVHPSHLGVC